MNKKFFWLLSGNVSGDYLTSQSRVFWDFTVDSDDEINSVINQVNGQGTSGINLVKLGTDYYPRLDRIQSVYDIKQCARLLATSDYSDVLVTDASPNALFTSSFRILFTAAFADFYVSNSVIFGVQDSAFNNGIQLLNNNGALSFKFAAGGNSFTSSASAIFQDGAKGETLFDIECDFENNTCKIYVDGVDYSFSVSSGSVSSVDPSTFNVGSLKLCIGGHNNNGTIGTTNSAYQYFTKFSVNPLMDPTYFVSVVSSILSTTQSEEVITVDTNYSISPYSYVPALWFDADDDYNYLSTNITMYDKAGYGSYSISAPFAGPSRGAGQKSRKKIDCTSASGQNLTQNETAPSELFANSKCTILFVASNDMIFGPRDSSGAGTLLDLRMNYFTDNKIYFTIGDGAALNTGVSSSTITSAVHLFAATFDGTQSGNSNRMKIYVDNVSVALSFTGTIPATTPTHNSNQKCGIGILAGNTLVKSNGDFYEGLLFPKLLTTAEMSALAYYYFRPKYGLTISAP